MNQLVQLIADRKHKEAMKQYHERYDNTLYTRAVEGKSSRYANALIDEALALCGSPYHKVSFRRWGGKAEDFLYRFAHWMKPKGVEGEYIPTGRDAQAPFPVGSKAICRSRYCGAECEVVAVYIDHKINRPSEYRQVIIGTGRNRISVTMSVCNLGYKLGGEV